MGKLEWNGTFTVTPKEIAVAISLIASFSVGIYRLGALEGAFREHLVETKSMASTLIVDGDRLNVLEMRIDPCCPLYHAATPLRDLPLDPRDIVPPLK